MAKNIESVRVTSRRNIRSRAHKSTGSIEGRGVVREAKLDEYRKDNEFVKNAGDG